LNEALAADFIYSFEKIALISIQKAMSYNDLSNQNSSGLTTEEERWLFLRRHKNLLILLAILVAILVILVVVIISLKWAHHGGSTNCPLVESAPVSLKSFKGHNWNSTSLVSSALYVQIFPNKKLDIPGGYLDLELDRIDITGKNRRMTMYHRGCADLAMQIYYVGEKANAYSSFNWILRFNDKILSCKADFGMSWPLEMRYSCLKWRAIPCFLSDDRSVLAAQFLFNSLEFELDGDAEFISHNRFSKQAYANSC